MMKKAFSFLFLFVLCSGLVYAGCVDSDGRNKDIKGQVTINNKVYEDKCASVDKVKEYYCSNNMMTSQSIKCDKLCEDGRCVTTSTPPVVTPVVVPPTTPPSTTIPKLNTGDFKGDMQRAADYCKLGTNKTFDVVRRTEIWVNGHVTYNANMVKEFSVYDTWKNGYGDCTEWANMKTYLLRMNDIDTRKVHGYALGEPHDWYEYKDDDGVWKPYTAHPEHFVKKGLGFW